MLHAIIINFQIFHVLDHYSSEIQMLVQEVSAAGLEIYCRSSCSTSTFSITVLQKCKYCAGSVRNVLQRSTQLQQHQPHNRLLVDLGCQSEAQATATVSQEMNYAYTSYGR